jgi:hypothetical protein
MDQVTQQNAALVEEAAAAASSLQEQAEHLEQAVTVFRSRKGGSVQPPARHSRGHRPAPARPQLAITGRVRS